MSENNQNQFEIHDEGSLHKYRTEIPNVLRMLDLDVYARDLYRHYKMVAGDKGYCNQSMKTLSKTLGYSESTIQRRNEILQQPQPLLGGKPLIRLTERKKENGAADTNLIVITDIWPENIQIISGAVSKKAPPVSGTPPPPSQGRHPPVSGTAKEEHCKKNLYKKGQCLDAALSNKKFENKGIDPKRFYNKLNDDQKAIHDELVNFKPQWGKPLDSKDICAWFLSRGHSVDQVRTAFEVYKQDASEASNKGRSVDNMGGAMVSLIKSGRSPRCPDSVFNRDHAVNAARRHNWIEVTERYVKLGEGKELMFDQPKNCFISSFDSIMMSRRMESSD